MGGRVGLVCRVAADYATTWIVIDWWTADAPNLKAKCALAVVALLLRLFEADSDDYRRVGAWVTRKLTSRRKVGA